MKKRPVGITLFGIAFILNGLFNGGHCVQLWARAKHLARPFSEDRPNLTPEVQKEVDQLEADNASRYQQAQLLIVGCLVANVMRVITGLGLLLMWLPAYWLALGFSIFGAALFVVQVATGTSVRWISFILILGWNGLVVWYFLRPAVKAQFVKAATSDK